MSLITKKFLQVRQLKKTAFMPFVVAGDPDFQTSLEIIKTLALNADFLELGFPYSDPLADGPTIQAANDRALKSGMNTDRVFTLIAKARKFTTLPITVLVYANIVYQYGIERFYKRAARTGINGVLVPDIPIEESAPYVAAAQRHGIDPIFLATQTTTPARLKKILKAAQGFLYIVSVLGVTGARKKLPRSTNELIQRIKKQTNLPLAVGFGISTPQQGRAVAKAGADGYIIGSALIKIIANQPNKKFQLAAIRKSIKKFSGHE